MCANSTVYYSTVQYAVNTDSTYICILIHGHAYIVCVLNSNPLDSTVHTVCGEYILYIRTYTWLYYVDNVTLYMHMLYKRMCTVWLISM